MSDIYSLNTISFRAKIRDFPNFRDQLSENCRPVDLEGDDTVQSIVNIGSVKEI